MSCHFCGRAVSLPSPIVICAVCASQYSNDINALELRSFGSGDTIYCSGQPSDAVSADGSWGYWVGENVAKIKALKDRL